MKIISYCIFGKEIVYKKGLKKNIDIAKELFHDWTVRIYVSDKLGKDFPKELEKNNTEIIIKKEEYQYQGLLWRMLPMTEGHEAVIVRDVDTRLFERDLVLVNDWMKSEFKYHICRDNPGSYQPILAGLWGGKNSKLIIESFWESWRKKYTKKNNSAYLWDQGFLKQFVYPQIRKNAVIYSENNFYEGEKNIRKIPNERGYFENRLISLGMYCMEDLTDLDNKNQDEKYESDIGVPKNQERINTIKDEEKFNYNEIKIFTPKYMYLNPILNSMYLIFTLIIKLLDFKNTKCHIFIYQLFLRRLNRKEKRLDEINIFN